MTLRSRATKKVATKRVEENSEHPRILVLRNVCGLTEDEIKEISSIEGIDKFNDDLLYMLPTFVDSYKVSKSSADILKNKRPHFLGLYYYNEYEQARLVNIYTLFQSLPGELLSKQCPGCGGYRYHVSSRIISLDEASHDKHTCVKCGPL